MLSLFALLTIVPAAHATDPCCRGACTGDETKFWRIVEVNSTTRCEETCLGSMKAKAVHLYERDLTAANGTNNPCADQGYPTYDSTVTSGMLPLKVTADRYAPTGTHEFIKGVADALGYGAFKGCFADVHQVVSALSEARQLYKKGGKLDKAKAMVELGQAAKEVVKTLEMCSSAVADVESYAKLVKNLKDPRFYTLHNAFTLALNIAEDRHMIASLIEDLESGRDYEAGKLLIVTVLDVLERPGIPDSNSSAAVQIAVGIADGFVGHLDIACFSDAHVEIKSLVGGVMHLLTHIDLKGLESIFDSIKDLPSTYKRCLADEPAIANLLRLCSDFKHPKDLAALLLKNMVAHGADLAIELGKGVLAFQGHEWRHLGNAVGTILNKIAVSTAAVVV